MQERPNKEAILTAIAQFLENDVKPLIQDPRVSYRLLVAANLLKVSIAELAQGERFEIEECQRLIQLYPSLVDGDCELSALVLDGKKRRELIRQGNEKLVHAIREDGPRVDTAIAAHVTRTLRDKLAIDNPRFDLSSVIE